MPESARRGAARAWSIDYGVRDLTAGGNEMHVIRLAGSVVAQVASGNVEMIRACHLFCRSGNCGRSDRRSAGASASHPGFERRPGMSWHRAAGARSVRKRRTGPSFLKMRPKRTGHAPKARQRMVDIFADGKVQLHRRANGRNGELYRPRQLPRNGESATA